MGLGLVIAVLILALALLPQLWVQSIIRKHGKERSDFPGTGGELARHLLDEMNIGHVKVETTKAGDHYDPEDQAVRLLPKHHDGRSLAAIVIAAHEVGHALQHADGYRPLITRTRMAKYAGIIETTGSVMMMAAPLMAAIFRTPHVMLIQMAAAALILSFSILIHAVTLPVEFDASFKRALPVLERGGYLSAKDMPAARELLRAAAFTYVAAAAMSLVDVMRWLRIVRF